MKLFSKKPDEILIQKIGGDDYTRFKEDVVAKKGHKAFSGPHEVSRDHPEPEISRPTHFEQFTDQIVSEPPHSAIQEIKDRELKKIILILNFLLMVIL